MMTDDGRTKSPYHGFILSCLILIGVSSLVYFLVYGVISSLEDNLSPEMIIYSSMMFGFGVGSLFNISCIILGLFKGTLKVVVRRIVNFFSNLRISPKYACMCYAAELKEDGAVFWGYFIIITGYLVLFAIGLYNCIEYYIQY